VTGFLRLVGTCLALHRDQWRSRDEIARLQWRRLQDLLAHAEISSPFWRERFAALGTSAAEIRTPADLACLPPTTRADLRRPERLLAEEFARCRLKTAMTLGSTGSRTTSYFDRDAWLVGKHLLKLRARLACGMRPTDRVALFQEADPDRRPQRFAARARSFSIHVPPEHIVTDVAAFAPDVLYGFPGHMLRLGFAAGGRLRPRLVFTSGELLDTATRRRIEAAFACRVFDVYGSTETKEIAWECPAGAGYHLNADWLLVETEPSGDGYGPATSRILVTSLYNRAMPLIRYELGDTGELLDASCPCGRGLPLMRPTWGRSVDYFILADGVPITPYDLTCAIEHLPGMTRYQIVQRARDRVEVLVQPGPGFEPSTALAIQAALRPVLRGLSPEIRVVEQLEHERSGKFRIVRSELGARAKPPADA
jgi:phenylacetate-CoA ligase